LTNHFHYIEDHTGLDEVVTACRRVSSIAIDTEFARTDTYYPIVGLIQIFTGEECYLIDPLKIDDFSPLADVLTDPGILKIFHACSEDLEVFSHSLGAIPAPVFDTQIACAATGVGFSVGYQAMIEHYLSITIAKDQTRSDWLARPLTEEQLNYAALDVLHLLKVYDLQMEALLSSNRIVWVEEETSGLGQDIPTQAPADDFYLKVKGLWQLDRSQLNELKILCSWRETTARERDVPRNRVVDQKALLTIVKDGLNSLQALQAEAGMTSRQVRKFGDQILLLQEEARLVPESEHPELVSRTDAPVNNKKLKRLREVVNETATRLDIAPELLTKRRHLEKLIRSEDHQGRYHLPKELAGWRQSIIGDALVAALNDH
jgi:ribonuclease D